MSRLGRSSWFDLPARDMADAMSFYQGLFGWNFTPLHDPPVADYWVIESGGEWIGGLRLATGENAGKRDCDAPVLYIAVERLAPAVAKARELGARLVGERVEMKKDRGVYQWFRDREENLLALWAPE